MENTHILYYYICMSNVTFEICTTYSVYFGYEYMTLFQKPIVIERMRF